MSTSSSSALTPPSEPAAAARGAWLLPLLVVGLLACAPVAYRAISAGTLENSVSVAALPGGRIDYLADPDAKLTFAQVSDAGTNERFRPLGAGAAPGMGPHWLRLMVPNATPQARDVVLEFAELYLHHVTVYASADESEAATPARTGQSVPLAARSVRSHLPAVHVRLPPGAATIWVRSTSETDAPSDVRLWRSVEDFRRYEQRQVLPWSLYLGLWGALLVYNAFVFAVLRDRVVLLYVCHVAAAGGLALIGSNFSAYFFTGPTGLTREVFVFVLLLLSCVTLVQFSRVFLETRRLAPRLDRALGVLLAVNGIALLGTPALFSLAVISRVASLLYLLALVTMLVLPLAGIYLWIRRCRQAPLYVVAFGCFTGGMVWMILAQLEIAPPDTTNGGPFLIGSALEMLLLSIAVAYRYRIIRDEKERLQANYAAQLETDVTARTAELRVANADKDRLISIIAHDVRSPLTSLLSVSRALARDPARRSAKEVAGDARTIEERCDALLTLVDNLLDWGRLRTGHLTREPAELNLAGLAEAAARPLQTTAAAKSLRLEVTVPDEIMVHADGYAVQCVLRNLLANAVKFTPAGGAIRVAAAVRDGRVEARVIDTGVGIAPERLVELLRTAATSEAGTSGENGVGIGLALCCELAEREGGELRLESTPGRGTVAILMLPAAAS